MPSTQHPIPFTLGSRRLLTVNRNLAKLAFSLPDILAGRTPPVPSLASADGLRVLSAPPAAEARLRDAMPGFLVGARKEYARSYIDMARSFDDYLARFSGKTRSTLRRKRRKFEDAGGGMLDLREYRRPEDMDEFVHLALPLSQRTYQARLLDAGLPESETARAEMRELAWQDRVRAFLLFLKNKPVAYLYLPVTGETLVYAYLGYDPDHANLSPGTVLQMAALESLFAERRFRYFDFTEGEGAHKALFGTDSITCASFLLLRPTLANRALLSSLKAFDGAVASAKTLAAKTGADALARRALRA
jgi:CelD/BcsL family acetyltransferase involved in cellulose biosynthesis